MKLTQLAEALNTTVDTVRHYIEIGLLQPLTGLECLISKFIEYPINHCTYNRIKKEIIMKKLTSLTLATLLALSPLAVVNANQHSDKEKMSMGMMDEAKMEKMQKHISEMEMLLEQVKKETDLEKRQEMLHQHAQSMENTMAMMHGGEMGKDRSMGMGKHKMENMKKGDSISSEQKMEMMEKRLEMMEKMMGQMMGHTAEKSKMNQKHK